MTMLMDDVTTTTPDRTLDQRMEALAKANEIRVARAKLKIDIKRGRVNALNVLLDPPAVFATMRVTEVLLAMPKIGRVKANRLLRTARCSPSKTLAGLSDRQRGELVGLLRRR